MNRIYLDYAASTPVSLDVIEAMNPFFADKFGNPSSLHSFGREAEIAVDDAREVISRFFCVDLGEVYFTSGATEANNWILEAACSFPFPKLGKKPHIVTSTIEHESVLDTCRQLEKEGKAEVTYLKPTREGVVRTQDVEASLKDTTVLVSLIYVNNETGVVQPIKEIGKAIERFRIKSKSLASKTQSFPFFHTDAVQAVQFFEPRLDHLKVDAMTVSSHKLYGPKGVGALLAKRAIPLRPLIYGGGQQLGKRSGTENVPGIVGFGRAIGNLTLHAYREKERKHLEKLQNLMASGIIALKKKMTIVCKNNCSPHILNVIFHGVESQMILIGMDKEGIAVSSGSACSVKALKPSHVLLSCGYSSNDASSAIRFSFGRFTMESEVKRVISSMGKLFKRISA